MKTFAQLEEWCKGARERFGDPAKTCGIAFFRYVAGVDALEAPFGAARFFAPAAMTDLVFTEEGGDLLLRLGPRSLPLRLSISKDGPNITEGGLVAFGVDRIADGLWTLNPSLNVPGVIHVFVVLYGVPPRAPWTVPA